MDNIDRTKHYYRICYMAMAMAMDMATAMAIAFPIAIIPIHIAI